MQGGTDMEENKIHEEINDIEMGIVKISDEVVSVIAGIAASEIKGITGMSASLVGEISQIFGGKKNASKGVKVSLEEDSAVIDLYITVEYGVKIAEVAEKVQSNVRRTVEAMTGLTVSAVNVFVQNVILPKSDKEDAKEN
jgi:uncharacterized alkaline shock family protein YloU